MQIVDATDRRLIASQAREAKSFAGRLRGLMLAGALPPGGALVLQPCSAVHMFFMRFRIDAVFYDRQLRVTRVARGLRPWVGVAMGGRGAVGVVEMAAGAADGVEKGHVLEFRREPESPQ